MRELMITNFREISGYKNIYGERIKPNKVFRGGPLNSLSLVDAIYMEEVLGLKYILDFRDEEETAKAVDIEFPNAVNERISALVIEEKSGMGFNFGAMIVNMIEQEVTKERIQGFIDFLKSGYTTMPFKNPGFKRFFDLALKGDGGIYFHCSYGKDRTGICAFLFMIALGVGEEDAIEEFLKSNENLVEYRDDFFKKYKIPKEMRELCEALLFVQKDSILLTIESIKKKYESYEAYFEKEYGIDDSKRILLREMYCE